MHATLAPTGSCSVSARIDLVGNAHYDWAYHVAMDFERITIDPATMRGAPCIRGLRIPVATVIGQLAAGQSADEILADFPDFEPEDITAALKYAAEAVQERELPLTRPA